MWVPHLCAVHLDTSALRGRAASWSKMAQFQQSVSHVDVDDSRESNRSWTPRFCCHFNDANLSAEEGPGDLDVDAWPASLANLNLDDRSNSKVGLGRY